MLNNIILIGYMGTGKTSISKKLGEILHLDVVDTDMRIIDMEERQINDIFTKNGEEYFRDKETDVLKELQNSNNLIISCGGGIILKEENIILMRKIGRTVLLTATPETIYNRIKENKERPLLKNMTIDNITKMLEGRKEKYLKASDIIVNTDEKSKEEITMEIIKALEEKE